MLKLQSERAGPHSEKWWRSSTHVDLSQSPVEKTDRLYRNIKDWVTIDDLEIEVHFVKEGSILSEDSRSSEKFIHGIKVLTAKNYIDNLGEEVHKGMLEKARTLAQRRADRLREQSRYALHRT